MRNWLLAGAGVLVVAVVTGAVISGSDADGTTSTGQPSSISTAKVERGKLAAVVSVGGTLTYRARSDGSPYALINRATGTYTELPEVGDKVGCGEVLYRVDERPVLLLCGSVPAYRDLQVGDQGKDVRQLNRTLHRLGFGAAPQSNAFTVQTQTALEKLQHDKGSEVTGRLEVGDAVVLPGSVRIGKVTGELGGAARPGAGVAQATSDRLEVQVNLDASQQGAVKKGDRAEITLPGNTSAKGTVERLGSVAQTVGKDDKAGDATIPAYLTLDKPADVRGLDSAPVQVEITTKGVENALSIPVTAIVGRAGGGFAVEVVRGGGKRELVAVKLGLFDDTSGRVGVHGDLAAGDDVVVPSS